MAQRILSEVARHLDPINEFIFLNFIGINLFCIYYVAYRFMFLKGHVTSLMINARTEDSLKFK